MLTRKIAPALEAGCTVVCKPANATPLSALALAELADRAGVPPGVINVVAGHTREIGDAMTSSPIVRKMSFTGSTEVGKHLMREFAGTAKRTSMELGGNAPFIVFDDADLDQAVSGAMASKFRNAGQTCVCANRFFVQDSVFGEFAEKLSKAVGRLKVGNGREEGGEIGPVIDQGAADNIRELVDEALSGGASLLGESGSPAEGPCFVQPVVLTGVTTEMRVCREEIFGPVAALVSFATEEDAIAMANDTSVGLASYFYSRDVGRIFRVAEALEYGIVGINEGIISNEAAPFGGIKESGQGREGSKYGLDDYLEIKYMCLGGVARG